MYSKLTALGAGIASAVLFALPIKGTFAALLLSFFAPLPTMIAAIGFGAQAGLIACFTGSLIATLVLHPFVGLIYLFTLGLPSCGLGLLAAQDADLAPPTPLMAHIARHTNVGALLAWIIVLSIIISSISLEFVIASFDSLEAARTAFEEQLLPLVNDVMVAPQMLSQSMTPERLSRYIIASMPAVMAVWSVVTFSLNLWLAARISDVSGLLHRAWPDLPSQLRLPLWLLPALLILSFGLFQSLVWRVYASIGLGAIIMGLGLHGLAVVHGLARHSKMRLTILISTYVVHILLIPWPVVVMAILAVIDLFFPLPRMATPLRTSSDIYEPKE
jgi:Predicted membrane protein (DUF2232)